MIVERSDVAMASRHSFVSSRETKLDIRTWARAPTTRQATNPSPANRAESPPRKSTWLDDLAQSDDAKAKPTDLDENGLSPQDAQKVRLIEGLIEALTGKKVKLQIWNGRCPEGRGNQPQTKSGEESPDRGDPGGGPASGGMEISYSDRRFEEESLSFSAKGTVKTADGKSLEFSIAMGMHRSESSETSFTLTTGSPRKKDPLVLNLEGGAPRLTDQATGFDLDADGKTDSVHFATGGSAFLARDTGSGLKDGSNLFGTKTGDGFADLAQLDGDGNGWIDSGDPAWAELRLWSRDESGQDRVWFLDEKGVGAISLANTSTPFTLKDAAGRETASLGQTGIWIGESGQAGTVNHVDLVA